MPFDGGVAREECRTSPVGVQSPVRTDQPTDCPSQSVYFVQAFSLLGRNTESQREVAALGLLCTLDRAQLARITTTISVKCFNIRQAGCVVFLSCPYSVPVPIKDVFGKNMSVSNIYVS